MPSSELIDVKLAAQDRHGRKVRLVGDGYEGQSLLEILYRLRTKYDIKIEVRYNEKYKAHELISFEVKIDGEVYFLGGWIQSYNARGNFTFKSDGVTQIWDNLDTTIVTRNNNSFELRDDYGKTADLPNPFSQIPGYEEVLYRALPKAQMQTPVFKQEDLMRTSLNYPRSGSSGGGGSHSDDVTSKEIQEVFKSERTQQFEFNLSNSQLFSNDGDQLKPIITAQDLVDTFASKDPIPAEYLPKLLDKAQSVLDQIHSIPLLDGQQVTLQVIILVESTRNDGFAVSIVQNPTLPQQSVSTTTDVRDSGAITYMNYVSTVSADNQTEAHKSFDYSISPNSSSRSTGRRSYFRNPGCGATSCAINQRGKRMLTKSQKTEQPMIMRMLLDPTLRRLYGSMYGLPDESEVYPANLQKVFPQNANSSQLKILSAVPVTSSKTKSQTLALRAPDSESDKSNSPRASSIPPKEESKPTASNSESQIHEELPKRKPRILFAELTSSTQKDEDQKPPTPQGGSGGASLKSQKKKSKKKEEKPNSGPSTPKLSSRSKSKNTLNTLISVKVPVIVKPKPSKPEAKKSIKNVSRTEKPLAKIFNFPKTNASHMEKDEEKDDKKTKTYSPRFASTSASSSTKKEKKESKSADGKSKAVSVKDRFAELKAKPENLGNLMQFEGYWETKQKARSIGLTLKTVLSPILKAEPGENKDFKAKNPIPKRQIAVSLKANVVKFKRAKELVERKYTGRKVPLDMGSKNSGIFNSPFANYLNGKPSKSPLMKSAFHQDASFLVTGVKVKAIKNKPVLSAKDDHKVVSIKEARIRILRKKKSDLDPKIRKRWLMEEKGKRATKRGKR